LNANKTSGAGSAEPNGHISPDASDAPARPFLKTYQLAFLLAAGTDIFFFVSLSTKINRILQAVFWGPVAYLSSYLPERWYESIIGLVVSLLLSLGYLFVLWAGIVWGLRHSSRGFKFALALCALAGWAGTWGLKAYSERIDWTSGGLNPDRPGFKPAVVLLAGTVDGQFSDWEAMNTAKFEIRMRGADYYYADRWVGTFGKNGAWEALMLSLPKFHGEMYRRHFAPGGGMAQEESYEGLLVARRLWRGHEFVGAARADEVSNDGETERFSELKQFGRFQIPERIEFTNSSRREVLRVLRVEFLNQPDTNWFQMMRQKYFENSEESKRLQATNLNEAGWWGERKR